MGTPWGAMGWALDWPSHARGPGSSASRGLRAVWGLAGQQDPGPLGPGQQRPGHVEDQAPALIGVGEDQDLAVAEPGDDQDGREAVDELDSGAWTGCLLRFADVGRSRPSSTAPARRRPAACVLDCRAGARHLGHGGPGEQDGWPSRGLPPPGPPARRCPPPAAGRRGAPGRPQRASGRPQRARPGP